MTKGKKITLKTSAAKTLENTIEEYENFGLIMKLSPSTLKHRRGV